MAVKKTTKINFITFLTINGRSAAGAWPLMVERTAQFFATNLTESTSIKNHELQQTICRRAAQRCHRVYGPDGHGIKMGAKLTDLETA